MTVRAQQPQVFAPVVAPVPVDVIDLQRHGLAEPLGAQPAPGALIANTDSQKCATQPLGRGPICAAVLDQHLVRGLAFTGVLPC